MAAITQTQLKVGEMVNAMELTVPVFTASSGLPGPKVYIQANIHGAEIQGNAVIYRLLHALENLEIQGEITLVPFANPLGLNQKSGEYTMGRFDPVTGDNWNRLYHCDLAFVDDFVKTWIDASDETIYTAFADRLKQQLDGAINNPMGLKTGQHICYRLQQMAAEADFVLDLHTGPASSRHLYVPMYAKDSAKYFNNPHVLLIPNGFDGALDEACFVPWWTLSEAYAKHGRNLPVPREAYTVELGSQEKIDMVEAQKDAEGILSYLQHKSVINGGFEPATMTRYACNLEDYKTVYAGNGGLVEFHARLGEVLQAGVANGYHLPNRKIRTAGRRNDSHFGRRCAANITL